MRRRSALEIGGSGGQHPWNELKGVRLGRKPRRRRES